MSRLEENIIEKYAWIVVHKRSGDIETRGGINFEKEKNKCPADVKINPLYKKEYENVRVRVSYYKTTKKWTTTN